MIRKSMQRSDKIMHKQGAKGAMMICPHRALVRDARADCPSNARSEARIAPQPLRGAVPQRVGNAAPGQGDADIRQRPRFCAKTPLVFIVADARSEEHT